MYGIVYVTEGSRFKGKVNAKVSNVTSFFVTSQSKYVSNFELTYNINAVNYKIMSYSVNDKPPEEGKILECVYSEVNPNNIKIDPEFFRQKRLYGYKLFIFGFCLALLMIYLRLF
jgi:hypothetical protein